MDCNGATSDVALQHFFENPMNDLARFNKELRNSNVRLQNLDASEKRHELVLFKSTQLCGLATYTRERKATVGKTDEKKEIKRNNQDRRKREQKIFVGIKNLWWKLNRKVGRWRRYV